MFLSVREVIEISKESDSIACIFNHYTLLQWVGWVEIQQRGKLFEFNTFYKTCALCLKGQSKTQAKKMGEQISLCHTDFISFVYMPSSEIAGPYGSSIVKFLKNFYIDFQSVCTNLHFH
jgi:hypothetical protein